MAEKLTARSQDQSKWYTEVVTRAGLADYSPVRGCMVIKPYGYAIWENIQCELDKMIKAAGVKNAYFPLFIPYSFLTKEADHVEGFAPEVAIVTHAGGKELEEKLVVRPTSETVIYSMFKDWIQSYRDLPLLINQWANVVRWEKRTTPFLRTTEFLWQEGHTAHASRDEAVTEVMRALNMYEQFVREFMAMHVVAGYKTEAEKFAGADFTVSIEGLMGDGKALQSGTSHLLGQNFAKAFDVKFTNEAGELDYVWQTSWGLSTRIIGGLILMHGDDKGLVIPPKIAPVQIMIVPIANADNKEEVRTYVDGIVKQLTKAGFSFETDWSDNTPGWKFAEAEMRGIPVRLEIGAKDMSAQAVMSVRRDNFAKASIAVADLVDTLKEIMDDMQSSILQKAKDFTTTSTKHVNTKQEFEQLIESGYTGFVSAYFNGDKKIEKEFKEQTKFGTRCIPFETYDQEGECIFTGEKGKLTLFAKAY